MGACQNQFHNVPDVTDEEAEEYLRQNEQLEMLARARDSEVIRSGSIKQQHKNVRPDSKEIDFGMIDRDRVKSQYLSQFRKKQSYSPTNVRPFSVGGQGNQDENKNMGLLLESRELDREQLHQTVRPYKDLDDQEIELRDENQQKAPIQERQRKELKNYDFYYSLALPEYVYPPIPEQHKKDFQDLVLGEQQERFGVKYIGEWKDDKIHGNGVLQSNTVKYIGQFKKGLKWFHGRQIEQDEVYEGAFENGRRKGQGVRYTEELTEEGQFDVYLKKGKIVYNNGDQYEGELENNKFNGEGLFRQKVKGISYKGLFKNGKLVKGRINYEDGRYYEGELENGMKNGKGYFYWDKNNYYEGEYKNGKKHGEGALLRDGKMYKGKFQNGEVKQIVDDRAERDDSEISNTEGESLPHNWKEVTN